MRQMHWREKQHTVALIQSKHDRYFELCRRVRFGYALKADSP